MAKGKAKASPPQKKPKGKLSAYMVFVKSCTENAKNENPGRKLVLTEFTQSCSKLWKQMSEEEKQPFKDLAEQDKRRFEDEKAEYDKENPIATSKGKESKAKPVKDKNAPKKPLSSYMLFCQDQRPILKASHPNLKFAEVAKTLGERWKAIDQPTREEYDKKAKREKERYSKAMDKYDPNSGAGSSKGKAVSKTPVKRPAKGSTQSAKKRQKVEKESSEEESSDEESSVEEAAKESSDEEESDESESESNAKSGSDKKNESSAEESEEESDEESEIDD